MSLWAFAMGLLAGWGFCVWRRDRRVRRQAAARRDLLRNGLDAMDKSGDIFPPGARGAVAVVDSKQVRAWLAKEAERRRSTPVGVPDHGLPHGNGDTCVLVSPGAPCEEDIAFIACVHRIMGCEPPDIQVRTDPTDPTRILTEIRPGGARPKSPQAGATITLARANPDNPVPKRPGATLIAYDEIDQPPTQEPHAAPIQPTPPVQLPERGH